MKKRLGQAVAALAIMGLAFVCMEGVVHSGEARKGGDEGTAKVTHNLRIVVNHGLQMLIGANMVLLADMKMSPALDEQTLARGRSMMDQGKGAIQRVLTGPEMQAMQGGGKNDDPLVEYTFALSVAMLKAADMLGQMELGDRNPDAMTLHHFHILINHALEMATQGSNLIMVGQEGTGGEIDRESVEQGRKLLTDARALIIEIMGGKAMREMHGREAGKMPEMGRTHNLAAAALEVLDLLDEMP